MPESTHPVAAMLKCYPPGTRALSLQDYNAAPDVPLIHASAGGVSTVVYVGEACGIRPVAVIVPVDLHPDVVLAVGHNTNKSGFIDPSLPSISTNMESYYVPSQTLGGTPQFEVHTAQVLYADTTTVTGSPND